MPSPALLSARLPARLPAQPSAPQPTLPPAARQVLRWLRPAALTLAASLAPVMAAHAAKWFAWEAVEMPAATGASCGNGTPYRFFVNRTPFTSKTVVVYEGGGACWDQAACKGGTLLDAANPEGIPANYMADINKMAKLGLVTPFTARIHPLQAVQTQSWNIVYVPYCTGDVHTGNQVNVYTDADPAQPLTYFHRGDKNGRALAAWLKANLPRPEHLLVTGFSAGGVGSTAQYPTLRTALNPRRMALLADSGPLMIAPRTGTPQQYPSLPLHNKIRSTWGLDGADGILARLQAQFPGVVQNTDDLGLVGTALAKVYPQDRLGFAVFQEDAIFSAFSYQKFFPDITAGNPGDDERKARLNVRWRQDIDRWIAALAPSANVGWYLPNRRDVNDSHCLTIISFAGTGIREASLKDVGVFVDNLLATQGPVLRAFEQDRTAQPSPLDLHWLITKFVGSLI
ncbi:MAG: hypothetical protein HZB72_03290 [Burkholderiales bacterium]|nr:hypothetical protein [Burkholderiales bacterium]